MKELKNWQRLHQRLVQSGEYRTARRLLRHAQDFAKYGRCSMSVYNNDDWFLAGELDPGNSGYSFKLS
ncbi:MAG: hypothetical protein LBU80_06015 [Rikenellaceae bacterium]|jgi:hypothetical protein|nr:hypothetical protein [Rikenellaceae bacterium]